MAHLSKIIQAVRARVTAFRAHAAKYWVTREVTRTLSLAHAVELSNTLPENWPQVKEKHALQIAAVRDGKLPIVDRRSWGNPQLPSTLTRIQQPVIKLVPYNLRRFSRTPVPRRAINLIKNAVTSLKWDIVPVDNVKAESSIDQLARIKIAKNCFKHPNNDQSFQSFLEMAIDDFCVNGAMVVEPQITPDPERPIKMWVVDASTIRFFPNWTESKPDEPKYAQMTGLRGERGMILFYDDELMYLKDNPSVDTPFGTGKMEIAFKSIVAFLGVQEMSGRAGADQVHRTWLWWEEGAPGEKLAIINNHIKNDLEGQSSINLMAGMKAPTAVEVQTATVEDLLLPWQEFLVRIICLAFDMSAVNFLERDVNRAVGEVLTDADFRSAVVPTAVRIAEYMTRFILHRKLGWRDLQFQFLNIDDPDLATKIDMLSKRYAMNSITADGICEALGVTPMNTPYSKLTQFELILLQQQAAASVQDNNANKQFQRQQQSQQQQFEQYQQMQEGQNQDQQAAAAVSSPKLSGLKTPKAPTLGKLPTLKLPKLPQMPMAGSIYSAHQIAAMSLGELKAAMVAGTVPSDPVQLQQNMKSQDPNVLQEMGQEVQDYLQWLVEQKKAKDIQKQTKITSKNKADQQALYKKNLHVPSQLEKTVYSDKAIPSASNPVTGKRNNITNKGAEVPTTATTGKRRRTGVTKR